MIFHSIQSGAAVAGVSKACEMVNGNPLESGSATEKDQEDAYGP